MNNQAQTVFIVDDDLSFLTSMARWLSAYGYTVESFDSAADFLEKRPVQASGCVVADLQMPNMDGMALQEALAESNNPLPVIFLTGHGDIPSSVQAMRHGAEDFLTKTVSKEELLDTIERALARDVQERKSRLRHGELYSRFAKLTPRENEVLGHVLSGKLNKQIAASLGIDERSVKRHRTHIMHKLDVKSVVQLAQLAAEAGWTNNLNDPSDIRT